MTTESANPSPQKKTPLTKRQTIAILGICALLGIVIGLFVTDIASVRRMNALTPHRHARDFFSFLRTPRQALPPRSPQTVQNTQAWMTFDYLNKTFGLPSAYLQKTLHITDAQYPNLSIKKLATERHLSATTVITSIETAIRSYTTSTAP